MYNVIMSLFITKSFNTNRQVDRKEGAMKISGLPLLPRRTAWFYHLHDNCLLVRSCQPNSSLPSPSQIMQEMLDKVFFCPNPINSSFALLFFFCKAQPGFVSAPPQLQTSCSPPLVVSETHTTQKKSKALHKNKEKAKLRYHTLLYTDGHASKVKASKNKTPARGAATASNTSKKRARQRPPR